MRDLIKILPVGDELPAEKQRALIIAKKQELMVKINTGALAKLDPPLQKYVSAALSVPVKERAMTEVQTELIQSMTSAYTICGQKADATTLAVMAIEVYSSVIEEYPRVTVDEIREAIRNGVYDKYGEYFGINPKSIMMFIRSYLGAKERRQAIEEWNKKREDLAELEREKHKPTPEQQRIEIGHYLNKTYWKFLAGDHSQDLIAPWLYDFMSREGLPVPALDVTAAKTYYYTSADKDRVRYISNEVKDGKEEERAAAIDAVSRQMAILRYFKSLRGPGPVMSKYPSLILFRSIYSFK